MQREQDPDPKWVEALSGQGGNAPADAIEEAQGEGRLFDHLVRAHERAGRDSYVEIDAPLEVHALVRLLRPTQVVEVGVSSGVSSAYVLNALAKNGHGTLHSVDLPSHPKPGTSSRASWSLPAGTSSGWAVPPSLRRRWDLRLGDKSDVLPMLAEQLPQIDLLIYDVPHEDTATWKEFQRLDPLVGPGGVAIVDHGPGGDLCTALRTWGRHWGARAVRRQGLGLYGVRRPGPVPQVAGPAHVGRP